MKSGLKAKHGGFRSGSGRKKSINTQKTKSVRIPVEITKEDISLLMKYKNHNLPLYNMDIDGGVVSIGDEGSYEVQKPDKNLLVADIEDHFMVKVSGHHMKEVGILENDILLVNHSKESEHNNIVVASNDNGKAVIKKLIIEGSKAKLISDNKNCADFHVEDKSDDRILGVVTRVIRDYAS
jgi:DNA polymerase V